MNSLYANFLRGRKFFLFALLKSVISPSSATAIATEMGGSQVQP
jgi:hypothetical protein